MPTIIKPELNSIILSDIFIIFLYFKINVVIKKEIAAIQNGIATLVKNNNGIPATVNPSNVRTEIKPIHKLWHT